VIANKGGVDHLNALVRERARKRVEQRLADACLRPPAEAVINASLESVSLGHVDPARAGANAQPFKSRLLSQLA
jgi:hypothetical protein